ncbi:hypothetical protein [Pelistega europaea]|uniref:Lipoprotein n=1 Tax=Pelistega europaea TaxID=106147 RepID=A0A7Y4P622_9BURK|nr:hypothetical protein [Pelistega europaea]NOL49454.1 hypothetical protein [Pelistega europaea]
MKISRILIGSLLATGLSGCFLTGSSPSTPDSVVVVPHKSKAANANTFNLYVGSTQKGDLKLTSKKKGKKKASTAVIKQNVEVKSGDVTYYTTGPIVHREDIRNVFVAKTVAGEPALGVRLSQAANQRLDQALSNNKVGTVLASLNDSVFSKVNNAGAKLEDGVLLLPMRSLNEARDVAELLRKK